MTSIIRTSAQLAPVAIYTDVENVNARNLDVTENNRDHIIDMHEAGAVPDREYLSIGHLIREAARWLGDDYDVIVAISAEADDTRHALTGRRRLDVHRTGLRSPEIRRDTLPANGKNLGIKYFATHIDSVLADAAAMAGFSRDSVTAWVAAHEIQVTRLYFVRRNRDAGSIWIDVETA